MSKKAIKHKPLPNRHKEGLPDDRFYNRELSWLAFNERVLEEAQNAVNPLLERVKFLAISASNLDEFYMVRVASLIDAMKSGEAETGKDGLSAEEQLDRINERTGILAQRQEECWQELRKLLQKERVSVIHEDDLSSEDKAWLTTYFQDNIFSALTPIAIDPSHPFPFLPNLGIAVVLELRKQVLPSSHKRKKKNGKQPEALLKAVIPLPPKLGRFIRLPEREPGTMRFIALEDVLRPFQHLLFPDSEVVGSGLIRITRSSEVDLIEQSDNLVSILDTALKMRRRADVVRMRTNRSIPGNLLRFLTEEFELTPRMIFQSKGLFGMADIHMFYDAVDRPDLKYPPMHIRFPERINDYNGDCFAAIEAKDIIVHHPYESFDVVAQFIRQAAKDPHVVAIKQTLYRTSNDSPIVHALIDAAEAGKSVTVVVELKARFDEEANLRWGRNLERAGAQVIYGLAGLKTHAKVSLVVRRVGEGLKSFVHYGTGNYHPGTAKSYADLSFFTCDPALTRDAALLFNYMTGYSPPASFEKIAVSPLTLRDAILKLIADEVEHATSQRPAAIWMKMNALVDAEIIDALYKASQAGVTTDLIIRGICCLKPGIAGLSDNIRVKSIVGRFLEHARIYCFGAGHGLPSPRAKVYISSADMMPRNLNGRVEVMVPVENSTVHEQVLGQIMHANLKDIKQSWSLLPDGSYRRQPFDAQSFSAHEFFIHNPSLSGRGRALMKEKEAHKNP